LGHPSLSNNEDSQLNGVVVDKDKDGSSDDGQNVDGTPHIAFKNVQFNYPSRPNIIFFDGFSGKLTGISLLERFYGPKAGSIEYCGSDIKALSIQ
jgi:ABC-type multidrug transport system fused ATPase/permease subunit